MTNHTTVTRSAAVDCDPEQVQASEIVPSDQNWHIIPALLAYSVVLRISMGISHSDSAVLHMTASKESCTLQFLWLNVHDSSWWKLLKETGRGDVTLHFPLIDLPDGVKVHQGNDFACYGPS